MRVPSTADRPTSYDARTGALRRSKQGMISLCVEGQLPDELVGRAGRPQSVLGQTVFAIPLQDVAAFIGGSYGAAFEHHFRRPAKVAGKKGGEVPPRLVAVRVDVAKDDAAGFDVLGLSPVFLCKGGRSFRCPRRIPVASTKEANQPSPTRATRLSAASLRPPIQMSIFWGGRGVMVTCSNR